MDVHQGCQLRANFARSCPGRSNKVLMYTRFINGEDHKHTRPSKYLELLHGYFRAIVRVSKLCVQVQYPLFS